MSRTLRFRPGQVATNSRLPFGFLDVLAAGVLLLGILWLAAHCGLNLYFAFHGLPTESLPQQVFDLFVFSVIECLALLLLHARGWLPFLDARLLKCLVDYTYGNIPKLLTIVIQQICKWMDCRSHSLTKPD